MVQKKYFLTILMNFNFMNKILTNFIQSGQEWYGEEFDADLTQSFSFQLFQT